MLFLLGVSLIFGVTGTLNMAALAGLIPTVPQGPRSLLPVRHAIMGLAFLLTTPMWQPGFWLPRTHTRPPPAVAALSALSPDVATHIPSTPAPSLFSEAGGP